MQIISAMMAPVESPVITIIIIIIIIILFE
jgi:hypothetical protein